MQFIQSNQTQTNLSNTNNEQTSKQITFHKPFVVSDKWQTIFLKRRGPIRENDKPHTSIASKVGSIKPTLNVAPSNANSFTHNLTEKCPTLLHQADKDKSDLFKIHNPPLPTHKYKRGTKFVKTISLT